MSTLQKVKAYFGMIPLDDFEDEYIENGHDRSHAHPRDHAHPYSQDSYENQSEGYVYSSRQQLGGFSNNLDDRPTGLAPLRSNSSVYNSSAQNFSRGLPPIKGSLALDPAAQAIDETNPLARITTLRPTDYSQARTIGERFRDGCPVIMDLVEMGNADAKRLVDFAAGLAFALRGSFDKVATKVFLLSPADIDVSADDRRRIAETGFYSRD